MKHDYAVYLKLKEQTPEIVEHIHLEVTDYDSDQSETVMKDVMSKLNASGAVFSYGTHAFRGSNFESLKVKLFSKSE